MLTRRTHLSGFAALAILSGGLSGCKQEVEPPLPDTSSTALMSVPQPPDQPKSETSVLDSEPASSGTILINQHGLSPRSRLRAVLVEDGDTPLALALINDRGQTLVTGMTRPFGLDPVSGLNLHQIDLDLPGLSGRGFRLRIGVSESDPFDLRNDLYGDLTRDSLSYFYQSRVGEAVTDPYVPTTQPPLTRLAGHTDQRLSCFAGVDTRGTVWPGCDYTLTISGGWYDAGDYGQYVVNTGFATWMLLDMAERRKDGTLSYCAPQLNDQSLSIPEAGNGIPDSLDEARRGVDYMLSMQLSSAVPQSLARGPQPTSGPLSLTLTDASGMAHHKSHGVVWPGDDVLPHTDTIQRHIYPPTTAATLNLAAIGAKCARVFAPYDQAFADRCLSAAKLAFAAAERVPDAYAWNEFTGGGPYSDQDVADEFGWAATELWLATGDADYSAAMTRHIESYNPYAPFYWGFVEPLGLMSLDSANGWSDDPAMVTARQALLAWADRIVESAAGTGFMIPNNSVDYYWGSNGDFMNRAIILAVAYRMTGLPKYAVQAQDAVDYILGRNPLGRSYVTGYGDRPVTQPHHRFWRGTLDETLPLPPAGLLSGGPNSVSFSDPVAASLRGTCQSMTCWVDDYEAYTMNEIAINWNASLAWVAHWLDRQDSVCVSQPQPHDAAR